MVDRERDRAALNATRAEYIQLSRRVRRHGIDAEAVRATVEHLSVERDGRWLLDPVAWRPTGVALGCPLPPPTTARLSRLLTLLERAFGGDLFTYVPAHAFHITAVNRSHFDETAPASLDMAEHEAVSTVVARMRLQRIEVMATGLFVTAPGRLLLECLPLGQELQRLRGELTAAIPSLRVHEPRTAHVKIAHLRRVFTRDELAYFFAALQQVSPYVVGRLTFHDVYTPRGRIDL